MGDLLSLSVLRLRLPGHMMMSHQVSWNVWIVAEKMDDRKRLRWVLQLEVDGVLENPLKAATFSGQDSSACF